MPDELRLGGAFALAVMCAMVGIPLARRVALRSGFLDRPAGYKAHGQETPYLGGMAVISAVLISTAVFADGLSRFEAPMICAAMLMVLGTIDDRVGLGIMPRLAGQLAAAVALWAAGAGWDMFGSDAAELTLTLLWVVGLSNAFNLMDNLDGAAGTVAAVSAAGAGALAMIEGDAALAAMALAVSGACMGFLPYNLARPSRIFLGDGGSMPIGLLLAAVVMLIPRAETGWTALLASAPLVGLVIFDTTLVVFSRRRLGARVLSGGRDHLSHRLMMRLGSPRAVAVVLGITQAILCIGALGLHQLGHTAVVGFTIVYLGLGAGAIAAFEGLVVAPEISERAS